MIVKVRRARPAFVDHGALVRGGQIAARGDKERPASHRRIDDAGGENRVGRCAMNERRERAPDDEFSERLRCVECAGLFAPPAVARLSGEVIESSGFPRVQRLGQRGFRHVKDSFVHGAELLHAQIGVADRLAAGSACASGERDHGGPHRFVPR